ncbi:hypothetical protein [Streptomyces sp. NPDC058202]|uniref:hypothetical protein n=1 Tax=Streptomyces sp. NPDC058202 TaxID=3346380 RepID=UPI0036E9B3CA
MSEAVIGSVAEVLPVVELEGPQEIACMAREVANAVNELMSRARVLLHAIGRNDALGDVKADVEVCSRRLCTVMADFTSAARDYLNGERRRRRWF